jgi:hypothetical protein
VIESAGACYKDEEKGRGRPTFIVHRSLETKAIGMRVDPRVQPSKIYEHAHETPLKLCSSIDRAASRAVDINWHGMILQCYVFGPFL